MELREAFEVYERDEVLSVGELMEAIDVIARAAKLWYNLAGSVNATDNDYLTRNCTLSNLYQKIESKLDEMSSEPAYQHEGEDFGCGVIASESAVRDVFYEWFKEHVKEEEWV